MDTNIKLENTSTQKSAKTDGLSILGLLVFIAIMGIPMMSYFAIDVSTTLKIYVIIGIFLYVFISMLLHTNTTGNIAGGKTPPLLIERKKQEEKYATSYTKYRSIVLRDKSLGHIDGKLMDLLIALETYESEEQEVLPIKTEIYDYARRKAEFLVKKDILYRRIAEDMKILGIMPDDMMALSEIMTASRELLEKLADSILHLTPHDPLHIFRFPNPALYRETLFEENSWIEGEANSILVILGEWLKVHTEELKGEKQKLAEILKQEDSHIAEILKITNSIHQQTVKSIQVQV